MHIALANSPGEGCTALRHVSLGPGTPQDPPGCALLTPRLQQALQLHGTEDKHGANTVSGSAAVTVLHELSRGFVSEVRCAYVLLYTTTLNALKCRFAEWMPCGSNEGMA